MHSDGVYTFLFMFEYPSYLISFLIRQGLKRTFFFFFWNAYIHLIYYVFGSSLFEMPF